MHKRIIGEGLKEIATGFILVYVIICTIEVLFRS